MTTSPPSPHILKGGLVLLNTDTSKVERIITFQYNPDTLTHLFRVKSINAEGSNRSEAMRLTGPPVETLKLEAEIEQLLAERGLPAYLFDGIYVRRLQADAIHLQPDARAKGVGSSIASSIYKGIAK